MDVQPRCRVSGLGSRVSTGSTTGKGEGTEVWTGSNTAARFDARVRADAHVSRETLMGWAGVDPLDHGVIGHRPVDHRAVDQRGARHSGEASWLRNRVHRGRRECD